MQTLIADTDLKNSSSQRASCICIRFRHTARHKGSRIWCTQSEAFCRRAWSTPNTTHIRGIAPTGNGTIGSSRATVSGGWFPPEFGPSSINLFYHLLYYARVFVLLKLPPQSQSHPSVFYAVVAICRAVF